MYHKVQLAAYMLNPKLKLENCVLSEEEEQEAVEFIMDLAQHLHLNVQDVIKDMGQYNALEGVWSRQSIWNAAKEMSAVTWWKGYCQHRELHKLAKIVFNLPTTAAACERNWSTFSNVKTKKE